MAKSKTARLSLTLPSSEEAAGDYVRLSGTDVSGQSTSFDGARRDRPLAPLSNRRTNDSKEPNLATSDLKDEANDPTPPTSPQSPQFTSLPLVPASPVSSYRHGRDSSKSFFSNLKGSKSSTKVPSSDSTIRQVSQDSSGTVASGLRKPKSRKDLKILALPDRTLSSTDSESNPTPPSSANPIPRRAVANSANVQISVPSPSFPTGGSSGSTSPVVSQSLISSQESQEPRRKDSLFHNLMKRNHTSRSEEPSPPPYKAQESLSSISMESTGAWSSDPEQGTQNYGLTQGASKDHQHHEEAQYYSLRNESKTQLNPQKSQSFREGPGANILSGIKGIKLHTAKAAEGMSKAGNRFFKHNKSAYNSVSTPADFIPNYQCRVINLPLIEQTRLTRIAKRLEDSRDKTEFWMPALPWRCIDYLNSKGAETEGLYRVPGSEKEIKLWRQRFDQEFDIDLFRETELYDVNTIGSLFKSWLRDLPEPIFPKEIQDELCEKHATEEKAPQALRDALRMLPPWNYYLLFAITCHLSLLAAHTELNKMTHDNLFICIGASLHMTKPTFRWLVSDWRACWEGCATEKESLEAEYRVLDGCDDQGNAQYQHDASDREGAGSADIFAYDQDRALSSSGSGRPDKRPPPLSLLRSNDEAKVGVSGANTTTAHSRTPSQLPELSLPKPISPLFSDGAA